MAFRLPAPRPSAAVAHAGGTFRHSLFLRSIALAPLLVSLSAPCAPARVQGPEVATAHPDVVETWVAQMRSGGPVTVFADDVPAYFRSPAVRLEVLEKHIHKNKATVRVDMGEENPWSGWLFLDMSEDGKRFDWVIWSTEPRPQRAIWKYGQQADMGSTAAGLAAGLAEVNPLPVPVLAVGKLAATALAEDLSYEQCVQAMDIMPTVGWIATGWNLAMIAGLGPAAIVPAVVAGTLTRPTDTDRLWACSPHVPESLDM